VIWSQNAIGDIRQIHDYIARDSKRFAKIVSERIVASVKRLAEFPSKGRVVPEKDDDSIRELIVYSYRVIYLVQGKDIEVVAILHGRQDLDSNLQ